MRVLLINPNSSQSMTDALKPVVNGLNYHDLDVDYFTCPTVEGSLTSINSPQDADKSAKLCLPYLKDKVAAYDGFLVACYSEHPLVDNLKWLCQKYREDNGGRGKYVTGIFEASITASLSVCETTFHCPAQYFGIVSTGQVWEDALHDAVREFLGVTDDVEPAKFVGCETTGLNASELHDLPVEQVNEKMKQAVQRLLHKAERSGGALRAICLGCAGMVGLEVVVREAATEWNERVAQNLVVVDGVRVGIGQLVALIKAEI